MNHQFASIIRESNANFFASMVKSIEKKYGKEVDDQPVIDIYRLSVHNPFRRMTRSARKSLENSSEDSIGYHSTDSFCSTNSFVSETFFFDQSFQRKCLTGLFLHLTTNPDPQVVKRLINLCKKRSLECLGVEELPINPRLRPIFLFYHKDDFVVTFIMDRDDISPWTPICHTLFGVDTLALSHDIYQIISGQVLIPTASDRSMLTLPTKFPTSQGSISKAVSLPSMIVAQFGLSSTPDATKSQEPKRSVRDFYKTSYRRNEPNPDSTIFSLKTQLHNVKLTLDVIRKNDTEGKDVARCLRLRAQQLLNRYGFPRGEDIHPFFFFHECGEISFSLVFDNRDYSPWSPILRSHFGDEFIKVCREIYDLMINPREELVQSLKRAKQLLSNAPRTSGTIIERVDCSTPAISSKSCNRKKSKSKSMGNINIGSSASTESGKKNKSPKKNSNVKKKRRTIDSFNEI